jgi:hypothetical protein
MEKRVDQYGFYLSLDQGMSQNQGQGLSINSQNQGQGLSINSQNQGQNQETLPKKDKEKDKNKELEKEWLRLLQDWDTNKIKKKKRIKTLTRMGIPDSLRSTVWFQLANATDTVSMDSLLQSNSRPAIFDVIERDIHRCFPSIVV